MAITQTQLQFPYRTVRTQGKVRDVYNLEDEVLVIVATDRISAFDVVLAAPIPYKGQVLNQTAAFFLGHVGDVCPTHLLAVPHPNVTIGLRCEPYPLEMVVRGYLCGHAWRVYAAGQRALCGVPLPNGLRENDPLPEPILTPSTKSTIGHDEDISEVEIIRAGLLAPEELAELKYHALQLYTRGVAMAAEKGLILADTKYEFGHRQGKVFLIDEVHTPDSSRYFLADGFEARQQAGQHQEQLSKEFVREWLMAQGFTGQSMPPPTMPDEFINSVSVRYIHLYEQLTGLPFEPAPQPTLADDVQQAALQAVNRLGL